jgi:WD40 repeat protein
VPDGQSLTNLELVDPMRSLPTLLVLPVLVACGASTAPARAADAIQPADPQLGRAVDFNLDVFPVFESKCLACHNKTTKESDLVLETVESILKGGASGPAVLPGKPDESLLYGAASRAAEPHMPPLPNKVAAKPLAPRELGILRKWIEEGARPGMAPPAGSTLNWQPVPSSVRSIRSVALSPDERFVAAGRANRIVVYDLPAQREVDQLTDPALLAVQHNGQPMYGSGVAHRDFVHALAISPDGNLLASAGYRVVKLWERSRNVQLQKLAAESPVTAIAVNADGTWAATAHPNNTVRLWNLTNGQPGPTLPGHTAAVTSLAFTPDGKTLVSGADDNTAHTWNAESGAPIAQLATPAQVKALTLNKDGTQLITGHADNVIRVWAFPQPADPSAQNVEPPKPLREVPGHGGPVTALVLMPATNEVLAGSQDGTARIWNLDNGQQAFSQNLGAPVTSVATSSDGQLIAAGGANNIARLWERGGKQRAELKGDPALDRRVIALTDEQTVAKAKQALADSGQKDAEKDITSREETLKKAGEAREAADKALAEAETKVQESEPKAKAAADELAAKPDDEGLKKKKSEADEALKKETEARDKAKDGVASAERAVNLSQEALNNSKQRAEQSKQRHEAAQQFTQQVEQQLNAGKEQANQAPRPILAVAFSTDGKQLATAGDDGLINLWDTAAGKPLDTLRGHAAPVSSLRFLEGGSLLSGSADQTAVLWETRPSWKLVARLGAKPDNPLDVSESPFADRVLCLDFSPDGTQLATGGGDPSRSGELLLWDVANRTVLRDFKDAHSDTVFDVDFSWDGRLLVSGAADKFVKVHEVDSGKLVRAYEGHTNHVLGVAWQADGATLASAGADNAIKLWNVETGEQRRTINTYSKQVTSIGFIGTTDVIASGSGNTEVRTHNAGNGSPRRQFTGAKDFIYAVTTARDDSLVIAGGEDGVLRVWNGANGNLIMSFDPPSAATETAAVR